MTKENDSQSARDSDLPQLAWQLAGLNALDRPVTSEAWSVPAVIGLSSDQNLLEWSWFGSDDELRVREARHQAGLLERFVQLRTESPEAILNYARRWGVLMICKHALPYSHNPPPPSTLLGRGGQITWCSPLGMHDGQPREPLSVWRFYAGQAQAMLNIATSLHDEKAAKSAEDWCALYGWKPETWPEDIGARPWIKGGKGYHRLLLMQKIEEWLRVGAVRPSFHWWDNEKRPAMMLSGTGLFGALALQLVLSISQIEGLAVCTACSLSYIPQRRPNPERRRYCERCRKRGFPLRDAARDYRSSPGFQKKKRKSKENTSPRENKETSL